MTVTRHRLYAGSYAAADQPGIHVFSFDPDTGALEQLREFAGVPHPSFVVTHPTLPVLYAVSELSRPHHGVCGAVWSLDVSEETSSAGPVEEQSTDGDWPCHLAIDRAGRWLVASNYGGGTVVVYSIRADGQIGPQADCIKHEPADTSHTHSATFSPDERFVIVADLGHDAVVTYGFDAQTGRLTERSRVGTAPGAGPRHTAFHLGGRWIFVANELDSTVGVFAYDAESGSLTELQTLSTLPSAVKGLRNSVADIHVTDDGDTIYVSNRGHDSITAFAVASNGRLTQTGVYPCGGRCPRSFAIAPGGRSLVVAGQHSNSITVLPVLADGRALGQPVGEYPLPTASSVHFGR